MNFFMAALLVMTDVDLVAVRALHFYRSADYRQREAENTRKIISLRKQILWRCIDIRKCLINISLRSLMVAPINRAGSFFGLIRSRKSLP
jgi:hypothetical protein